MSAPFWSMLASCIIWCDYRVHLIIWHGVDALHTQSHHLHGSRNRDGSAFALEKVYVFTGSKLHMHHSGSH